jgi:hypothetical protein
MPYSNSEIREKKMDCWKHGVYATGYGAGAVGLAAKKSPGAFVAGTKAVQEAEACWEAHKDAIEMEYHNECIAGGNEQ